MTVNQTAMPLDLLLSDDGLPPCLVPDTCPTCSLFPRPGEQRLAHLDRLGERYRRAPTGKLGRPRREGRL